MPEIDVKQALDEFNSTFEQFKATVKDELAEVKKGQQDVITSEKLDRVNDDVTKKYDEVNELIKKQQADHEAEMDQVKSRLRHVGSDSGDSDLEQKANTFCALTRQKPEDPVEFLKNYEAGFSHWLRRTEDRASLDRLGLNPDEQKALSVGGDPQGGYYVPPTQSGRIIRRIFETSPVRAVAEVVTIGTDRFEFDVDRGEFDTGWVGEKQGRPETDTSELGKLEIAVHEQYAMPKVTQNLLDDAQFDVESWMNNKVADRLSRRENAAFVNGDGVRKPRGILAVPVATTADIDRAFGTLQAVKTGKNGAFPDQVSSHDGPREDILIDLMTELNPEFTQGARWAMNRRTLAQIRKFRDAEGRVLVLPNVTATGLEFTLHGHPVSLFEDMPNIATNSLSIAFGNFQAGYTIVDRAGIRLLVDPFTDKPNILMYTTKRVGGGVTNSDAIKLLQFAA